MPLDLSWLSDEEQIACALLPSQIIEFDVDGGLRVGSDESDDDDDGFLASLPADSRAVHTSAGSSILVRAHGLDEWNEILLQGGETCTENLLLDIREQGSGVYIDVYNQDPAGRRLLRERDTALICLIRIQQLCIRVLDDERGRIVGGDIPQPVCLLSFKAEEFKASFSTKTEPQCQKIDFQLGVGELHSNMYFPTEQPLLWSTAAADRMISLGVSNA